MEQNTWHLLHGCWLLLFLYRCFLLDLSEVADRLALEYDYPSATIPTRLLSRIRSGVRQPRVNLLVGAVEVQSVLVRLYDYPVALDRHEVLPIRLRELGLVDFVL